MTAQGFWFQFFDTEGKRPIIYNNKAHLKHIMCICLGDYREVEKGYIYYEIFYPRLICIRCKTAFPKNLLLAKGGQVSTVHNRKRCYTEHQQCVRSDGFIHSH
jgi:hypothetical protein